MYVTAIVAAILLTVVPNQGSFAADDSVTNQGTEELRSRAERLRLRFVRRHIRDLRLELAFVEKRLAQLPAELQFELRVLEAEGLDEHVRIDVTKIFGERQARLQERLELVSAQIERAELRLAISTKTDRKTSGNRNTKNTITETARKER